MKKKTAEDVNLLMEKCFDCFCKNGLEGTSTQKLAEACGMSAGNIFHYFATKDEIIIRSTAHCMAKVEDEFMANAPKDAADIDRFFEGGPVLDGDKARRKVSVHVSGVYVAQVPQIRKGIFCGRTGALRRICQTAGGSTGDPASGHSSADLYFRSGERALRPV